jgi:hypothetical protein
MHAMRAQKDLIFFFFSFLLFFALLENRLNFCRGEDFDKKERTTWSSRVGSLRFFFSAMSRLSTLPRRAFVARSLTTSSRRLQAVETPIEPVAPLPPRRGGVRGGYAQPAGSGTLIINRNNQNHRFPVWFLARKCFCVVSSPRRISVGVRYPPVECPCTFAYCHKLFCLRFLL